MGAPHFWRIRSNLVGVPTAATMVAAPRRATRADAVGGGGGGAAEEPKKVVARGAEGAASGPGTKAAMVAGVQRRWGGGG